MRVALDSSVLVGYFIDSDSIHAHAVRLIDKILDGTASYACVSKITVAETGYVLERKTKDETFAYTSMHALTNDLRLDVLDLTWEFTITLSHLKAINPVSFCDNATITAARLTNSSAVFTKEKEILAREKGRLQGASILFLEELA
ncbi:MAG: PIN domain-containing protein [Candidatus Lokiarchaeota archaeon]|nr:PIN domain-containing protein [Candidatus Lokiarchaeota archaeon]